MKKRIAAVLIAVMMVAAFPCAVSAEQMLAAGDKYQEFINVGVAVNASEGEAFIRGGYEPEYLGAYGLTEEDVANITISMSGSSDTSFDEDGQFVMELPSDGKAAWGNTYSVSFTVDGNTYTKKAIVKKFFADATVKVSGTLVYNGKALSPTVKVTAGGKKLSSSAYEVWIDGKRSGAKTVGIHYVDIIPADSSKYDFDWHEATYKILPKGTAVRKLQAKQKRITVIWKKQAKETSGYQIQYTTVNKVGKKSKKVTKKITINNNKTVKRVIKRLNPGQVYRFRIRTFKTSDGKKYYSAWSKYKKVRTKPAPKAKNKTDK